ncbi:hypothetical protein P171DRAFT_432633 [Karstenula rhodostoma CBS 690.94]|uniref:RING-type domain-containing protein n=1 Tax=Karstenula rhodostoma CBS 690.94 TaxID=1392251 RepID=A0A9P4UAS3_9PLEO|nr:hypothetical protein P171DRAFT_432633 [Karstenula rhodostoma CBS 690.94]
METANARMVDVDEEIDEEIFASVMETVAASAKARTFEDAQRNGMLGVTVELDILGIGSVFTGHWQADGEYHVHESDLTTDLIREVGALLCFGDILPSRDEFLSPSKMHGLLALLNPCTTASSTDCCPVCQDDITELASAVVVMQCDHIFHAGCIEPWLLEYQQGCRGTCPLCREKLFVMPGHENCTELECKPDIGS